MVEATQDKGKLNNGLIAQIEQEATQAINMLSAPTLKSTKRYLTLYYEEVSIRTMEEISLKYKPDFVDEKGNPKLIYTTEGKKKKAVLMITIVITERIIVSLEITS
jgi:hypothetical protein